MTKSELLDLIAAGESEMVEFKREMDRAERLARESVALANRQGGMVLVGVDGDALDAGCGCGCCPASHAVRCRPPVGGFCPLCDRHQGVVSLLKPCRCSTLVA